jgi:hypothetical protein
LAHTSGDAVVPTCDAGIDDFRTWLGHSEVTPFGQKRTEKFREDSEVR